MKVEYIAHLGNDLMVSNCARVSFAKWKEEFDTRDASLINYLANHDHWTPFAHCIISLRVTVPIFVARQLDKHQIGLTKNEVSRRYVDTEPEFYLTDKLGKRAPNKKQGSLENEFITEIRATPNTVEEVLQYLYEYCYHTYKDLLDAGCAPEDARMVLPLATYTSWIWTGSLAAFARVYNLRSKSDAQRQTREVAEMISEIIEPLFPHSWKALTNG